MRAIEITGLEELARHLGVALEQLTAAAGAAVYAQALVTLETASLPGMCPVQSGELKASGYVTLPEVGADGVRCEIGYGVHYAPEVHERSEWLSGKSKHRGAQQWLLRATNRSAEELEPRLHETLVRYISTAESVSSLRAAGVPTSPQLGGNRETAKAMVRGIRSLKKQGRIKLVRKFNWNKRKNR